MPPIQELNFSHIRRASDDNVTVSTIGTDSLFSKPLVESRWEAHGEQTFEASLEAEDWVPQSPIRQQTKESIKYSRNSLLGATATSGGDRHLASGLPFTTIMDSSATTTAVDDDEEEDHIYHDDTRNHGGANNNMRRSTNSNESPKLPVRQETLSFHGNKGMSVSCHEYSSTSSSASSAKRSSWCREVSDNDVLKMPHRQRTLESIPSDYYRAYTDTVVANTTTTNTSSEDDMDTSKTSPSSQQDDRNTTTTGTGRKARIAKPAGLRAVGRSKTTPEKPNTRVPRSLRISATDSTATIRRRGSATIAHGDTL